MLSTNNILKWSDSFTQIVVSNTSYVRLVRYLVTNLLLEHKEMVEEVTFTAPEVICKAEAG